MTADPRYVWPAQAMAPHAERRDQVQPEPALAAEDNAPSRGPVPLADGWHRDYRFWVVRDPSALHPIVHIQGWDGPRHVSISREMKGACLKRVRAWIDATIEQVAAAAAKKRAPSRRKVGR